VVVRPAARLVIDGRDVSTAVFGEAGVLVSLTINDEAGLKSDTLEIELDDREGFKAPPKGAEIKVWLGYEPSPVYMGRFTVDTWSKRGPARTLSISAKAAEMTTEVRSAKSRSFDQETVGGIVTKLAGEHRLTAVIDPALASIAVAHIDQQNESDLHFLSRLARRVGATFKLADGKAIFAKRGSSTLPSGGEKASIILTPAMTGMWEATSADRGNYKAVKASYMDHAAGKRVSVTAGSGKPEHRDRKLYATKAEAEAAAAAQLGDLNRGQVQFEAQECPGLPSVFAEALIKAEGFDPDVDGEFLIKSVSHTLDSGGYRTSISMETKGTGSAPTDD
jgi:phage protein D